MDSDDSYSDCSTDTDTLQSQREAIGRASFRNCMRGAYFNIQHTGNYRRRVTKLLKIIRVRLLGPRMSSLTVYRSSVESGVTTSPAYNISSSFWLIRGHER